MEKNSSHENNEQKTHKGKQIERRVGDKVYFQKKVKDWDILKNEYIYGIEDEETGEKYYPTAEEIAERYNITPTTVFIRSSKERWSQLRALVKTRFKERRTAEDLKDIVSASSNFDSNALDAISKIYKMIHKRLDKYEVLYNPDELEKYDDEDLPEIDAREIETMTKSVNNLVTMTRKLLGESDTVESIAEEIRNIQEQSKVTNEVGSESKITELDERLKAIKALRNKGNMNLKKIDNKKKEA